MRVTAPCLAVACLLLASTAGRAAMFDGIPAYRIPNHSASVVAGDFNGDGAPDIAVARSTWQSTTLTAVLGDGTGGFVLPGDYYTVGDEGWDVVMGDFNADGIQDLAESNWGYTLPQVVILQGVGDGTFKESGRHATAIRPSNMAVGDFNADDIADIAVATSGVASVGLLLGLGGGEFGPCIACPVGANPQDCCAGDLDGDGDDDLVVQAGSSLRVFLSSGDGSLTAGVVIYNVEDPSAPTLVDLDGDGHLDLVVGETDLDSIAIWYGLGGGAFSPRTRFSTDGEVNAIFPYDLDGNGHMDLVVGADDVTVHFGPSYWGGHTDYPVTAGVVGVAVCQTDADGIADVVAVCDDQVATLKGNGGGGFAGLVRYTIGVNPSPRAIRSADIDGDGNLDVMTANYNGDDVTVLAGDGHGVFAWTHQYHSVGDRPWDLAVADATGDGVLDWVVTRDDRWVRVYVGDGDGTFSAEYECEVSQNVRTPAVADFNEDGHPDVAVAYGYDAWYQPTPTGVAILLGDGTGRLEWIFNCDSEEYAIWFVVGDFNGDGHDDIVSSASRWSGLFFYAGHGDGLFDPGVWFAGAYSVDCAVPTDLDGDGALDLVAACGGEEILFLRGLGDGTFAPSGVTPNGGTAATSIVVRDFDCDGTPDVALGGQCRVCAWHGVGDGTFASRECYLSGGLLATGDFDGDGDPDLAATGDRLNYVTALLSTGSDTAVEGVLYGAATGAESVTLGWSLGSLSGVRWLHVYRSVSATGPFARVNEEPLEPSALGSYEDATVWPGETFWYELRSEGWDGSEESTTAGRVQVRTPGELVTRLSSAMANPSAGGVQFEMDVATDVSDARLVVYDVSGREVRVLVDGRAGRGRHAVEWDGRDGSGHEVAAGVYFARLVTPERTAVCKIAVVK